MKKFGKKFGKYILLVSSILILVFSLTACSNGYKFDAVPGGQADKPTESNGGQVVKQGDKLYFVNGKTDEKVGNDFGSVIKGAIVRGTIGADGKLSDFKTIVPKNVYSKGRENGKNGGIYIFDNYIYYLTPNNEIDKNDKLLNDRLDVMRVKIDGTGTEKLGTPFISLDYEYKFVKNHLVTFSNGTITIMKLEDNLPVVKKIENVTGMLMPKTETYEKGKEYASDYIFYTRNLTEKESEANIGARNNVLCAVKCDGSKEVEIVNTSTNFADGKNDFTITLKDYLVSNDAVTIYYNRKSDKAGSVDMLYSYTFDIASLNAEVLFDSNKETLIYSNATGTIIPYTADTVLEVKDKVIVSYNKDKKTNLTFVTEGNLGTFDGTVVKIEKEGTKDWMYYTTASGLFRVVLADNGVIKIGSPVRIYDASIGANVFGNELIDGYFYFSNSTKFDYVYRVDVTKDNTSAKLEEDDTRVNPEIVGFMNQSDKEKLEKAEKENK